MSKVLAALEWLKENNKLYKDIIIDEHSIIAPKIIDLSITRDKLEVETSPVASVILVGYGSASIVKHGNEMKKTVINFPKDAKSPWVRVIVIDQNGKKAWTNPIWTEEL